MAQESTRGRRRLEFTLGSVRQHVVFASVFALVTILACGGSPIATETPIETGVTHVPSAEREATVREEPPGPNVAGAARVLQRTGFHQVDALATHPTRPVFVSVDRFANVAVVSSRTGSVLFSRRLWRHASSMYRIAFDPDGNRVALAAIGQHLPQPESPAELLGRREPAQIRVLDLNTGDVELVGRTSFPGFSPLVWLSATRLAWVTSERPQVELAVYDFETQTQEQTELPPECSEVFAMQGRAVVRCSARNVPPTMLIFSESSLANPEERAGDLFAAHSASELLAIANDELGVRILRRDGREQRRLTLPEQARGEVRSVRFSRDGSRVAVTTRTGSRSQAVVVFSEEGTPTTLETGALSLKFNDDLTFALRAEYRQVHVERVGGEVTTTQVDTFGGVIAMNGGVIATAGRPSGLTLLSLDLEIAHEIPRGGFGWLQRIEPIENGFDLHANGFVTPFTANGIAAYDCDEQRLRASPNRVRLERCRSASSDERVLASAHYVDLLQSGDDGTFLVRRDGRSAPLLDVGGPFEGETDADFQFDDAANVVVIPREDGPMAFDTRTGRLLRRLGDQGERALLAGDGRAFVRIGSGGVRVADVASGREFARHQGRALATAVSTTSMAFEVSESDHNMLRAYTSDGGLLFRTHFSLPAIALSLDEERRRVVRFDRESVLVLSLDRGERVARFPYATPVGFFERGMFACVAGELQLLSLDGDREQTYGGCPLAVEVVATRDGSFVAVSQGDQVTIVRVADGRRIVVRQLLRAEPQGRHIGFWIDGEHGDYQVTDEEVAARVRQRRAGRLDQATVSELGAPSPDLVADFFSGR